MCCLPLSNLLAISKLKLGNTLHFTVSLLHGLHVLTIVITVNYHNYMQLHSKKCWVVSTQIWVKYGQTQMLG